MLHTGGEGEWKWHHRGGHVCDEGGWWVQVDGMARSCHGCRDTTPPVADEWIQVPHRMWFGRTRTVTWGEGGVCFLSLRPSTHPSHVRLYKITLEQFNDVIAQENPTPEGVPWGDYIDLSALQALKPPPGSPPDQKPAVELIPVRIFCPPLHGVGRGGDRVEGVGGGDRVPGTAPSCGWERRRACPSSHSRSTRPG